MRKYLIKNASISLLKAPLIRPFRTALGEHNNLENLFFTIELRDNTKGYGEAAIATHITGETIKQTKKSLKIIGSSIIGKDIRGYLETSLQLHEMFPDNKAAVAAVEIALLDALTRQAKVPLRSFFGRGSSKLITDITVVISDLDETENFIRKFYNRGFRAFKVKIGRDPDLDLKRVLAIKRIVGRSKIYLDANQGYTSEETLRFLGLLRRANIQPDLIEQPVPKQDWEGLKKVSRLSRIPVCADESAQSPRDCLRIIQDKAADVINIKLMKSGFIQAKEIALLAKRAGLGLMIGGMMESSLAMTAAAHLACGLGGFKYIDLDTPFFIKGRFGRNPYLSSSGVYNLSKVKAGIGITLR